MSNTELDDDTYSEAGTETQISQYIGVVSDFLQGDAVIGHMKSVVMVFVATGVVLGVIASILVGSVDEFLQGIVATVSLIPMALLAPVLGVIAGQQLGRTHCDAQPLPAYALITVSTGVGAFLLFMIGALFSTNGTSSVTVGNLFVFSLVVAVGTVVAAGVSGYAARSWE